MPFNRFTTMGLHASVYLFQCCFSREQRPASRGSAHTARSVDQQSMGLFLQYESRSPPPTRNVQRPQFDDTTAASSVAKSLDSFRVNFRASIRRAPVISAPPREQTNLQLKKRRMKFLLVSVVLSSILGLAVVRQRT